MTKNKFKATSCLASICAIILAIVMSTVFAITGRVKAISPTEDEPASAVDAIVEKMKTNAVYECLTRATLSSASTINDYYADGQDGDGWLRSYFLYSVFNEKDDDIWSDENAVKVPFKLGDIYIKDGGISCTDAFESYVPIAGNQTYPSNVSSTKYSNIPSTTALDEAMNSLGYTYTIDNSQIEKKGCFRLEVQTNDSPVDGSTFFTDGTASAVNSKAAHTNYVCFNLDSDNKVVNFNTEGTSEPFSHFTLQYKETRAFVGGVKKVTPYDVTASMSIVVGSSNDVYPAVYYAGSPMTEYHPLTTDYYEGYADKYLGGTSTMYPNGDYNNYETLTWDQIKQFANNWASDLQDEVMYDYSMGGFVWLNLCKEGNEVVYYPNMDQCGDSGPVSPAWSYVKANFTEPAGGDNVGKKVWSWSQTDFSDALKYFTGMDVATAAYTDDDVYTLSLHLLKNIYNLTFVADASSDSCGNTASSTTIPVKVKSTGEIRYCQMLTLQTNAGGVKGTNEDKSDGTVNAIQTVGSHTLANMDAYGLLAAISSVDASKVTDDHIVLIDDCSSNPDADGCSGGGGGGGTGTPDPEEDECDPSIEANTKDVECQEKGCYKEAGSMGWIICPVIFGVHDFVDNIYDHAIVPLLSVDKGIVYDLAHMDNSSATYKGWAMFRNIANILFAIVLLVVVFSQVTGFGIDNYGVKKILPKLIVTAILVNLSYILCGILVDASNMLGAGIKGLFENAAGTVTIGGVQTESAKMTGIILNGLLILVAGGSLAAGGMAWASGAITGWSIVLPLLLIVLSAVITVIVALIILGARQAIILILIVVSPFAFVCYALPNLNGVFKKWLKLFEAMLMVFPICGALVGGGYFASCIMLGANSEGNILTLIISAILCMVPYFLIPSVTGRAMNAVGGLASRAMGMGRGLSNGVGGRIRNSEAYKNRIKNSQDAAHARAANRYLNSRRGRRDLATVEGGGTLNRHRSARLSNALKNANSNYALNKDILDESQNRQDIASGSMAAVDAYKRDQSHRGLDDQAAHIPELAAAAEVERMDANFNRQYANNNDSAAIEAEAIALAGQGLGDPGRLSQYNAAMNRLAKIDPSAYRRAVDGSIAAGNHDAATRQAIKDNTITNSDVAKEQGLKGVMKANAANGLDTADSYTQQQAASSVKDMLNLDDDYIARLAGDTVNGQGAIATNSNIQDTARMALDAMAANPKMAEDKKAKYLNDLVRIATNGTQSNYADYQANQAAIANQDLISVDLATGGQLTVDRREIPNGDAKQIDPTRSRRIASDEMQIVFKDGSQYNTKSKVFTPSHNQGGNP